MPSVAVEHTRKTNISVNSTTSSHRYRFFRGSTTRSMRLCGPAGPDVPVVLVTVEYVTEDNLAVGGGGPTRGGYGGAGLWCEVLQVS